LIVSIAQTRVGDLPLYVTLQVSRASEPYSRVLLMVILRDGIRMQSYDTGGLLSFLIDNK
jgi:hypothetical protein